MRIAFAGCWHANSLAAIKAIEYLHAQGVSTIVHTGDFLYTNPVTQRFLHVVNRELAKRDMLLVLVRGNHDNPGILQRAVAATPPTHDIPFTLLAPHVLHAPDGTVWEWEGVRFAALGGARSVDWSARKAGKEWWIDEATDPQAIATLSNTTFDILVTHDVPGTIPLDFLDRSSTPTWWDIAGAEAHRQLLSPVVENARPQLVVSGHMHTRHEQHLSLGDHTYHSVILDRGDYPITQQTALQVHQANLYTIDIKDGMITQARTS